MSELRSDYMSKAAVKTVNRIGDILCPGNEEFPSYSETGCIEHIDKMLATVPSGDMGDLNLLLTILSIKPKFVLRWLVRNMGRAHEMNGPIADLLRMLDFGLRGIIFGTYYSGFVGADYKGKTPYEVLGYGINRVVD